MSELNASSSTLESRRPAPQNSADKPSPWIISARGDWLFLIGTPVLCIACIVPLKQFFTSDRISWFLLGVFAVGHHLPGFLRAYGDSQLFRQFRIRFLFGPPLVFASALWFGWNNLQGLLLITILWDVWHSLMQHYGFMRIYDARIGNRSKSDSRLDLTLCLAWFFTIVINSPVYSMSLLKPWIETTGITISRDALGLLRLTTLAVTVLITIQYVLAIVRKWHEQIISIPKICLLLSTFGFIAFAWWGLDDLFLGYAMWAVYHDIQYVAITWIYNRRLVNAEPDTKGLISALFRRRGVWLGVYLAFVFGYGASSLVPHWIDREKELLHNVLGAMIATSTLLHYWYDGFIWKVRDSRIRRGLNVGSQGQDSPQASGSPQAFGPIHRDRAALRHLAYLIIPLALMGWFESSRRGEQVPALGLLAETFPDRYEPHYSLAKALLEDRQPERAEESFSKSLDLARDSREWRNSADGLAESYFQSGRDPLGLETLERILAKDPDDIALRTRIARGLTSLEEWTRVETLSQGLVDPPTDLLLSRAFALSNLDRYPEAFEAYGRLIAQTPSDRDSLLNHGIIAIKLGRNTEAFESLDSLIRQFPDATHEWFPYGRALFEMNRHDEARLALTNFLELTAGDPLQTGAHEFARGLLARIDQLPR